MAVDGGRLGRATNPSDNHSSHNNVKYRSWGMPWEGRSLVFSLKENQTLTENMVFNTCLFTGIYMYIVKIKEMFTIILWFGGGVSVLYSFLIEFRITPL